MKCESDYLGFPEAKLLAFRNYLSSFSKTPAMYETIKEPIVIDITPNARLSKDTSLVFSNVIAIRAIPPIIKVRDRNIIIVFNINLPDLSLNFYTPYLDLKETEFRITKTSSLPLFLGN